MVGSDRPDSEGRKGSWTFLSNHAHVLVCLAKDPDARLRDVAEQVGITERGAFRIVSELEEAGVLTRSRTGRRNHYELNPDSKLRHPLEAERSVGGLLSLLLTPEEARRVGVTPARGRRERDG